MAHDTIVMHSLHGAGAMEKITFTLIKRFQTNRRYHASLTQSLPSSVNLIKIEIIEIRYESVFLRNVNQTTN